MDRMPEKRINEMVEAVMKVARGDYSVQVELSGQNDEFDSLAMGLNMMIDDVRAGFEGLDRQRKEVNALNKKLEKEITDHKTVEELYQTLANSSPVGVYTVQDGKFQFANPQFQKYTGYTEDELLGMVSLSIVHPEDRERVRENAVEMLKGNRLSPYELRYISKGGETIWAMETVTSIHYEGKRATLGNFMDITERKQAEEALRQAEEKLRAYLESAPDGVYLNDLKGTFLYGNKRAEEIIGYDREELIGRSFLELGLLPEDYLEKAGKLLELNAMGKPTGPDEFELVSRDGSRIWVEINTAAIREKGEDIVIGFVRDITERKQAEEKLRESEEEYKELAESIADVFFALDKDLRYTYWNKASEELTGTSAQDALGKHLYDLFPNTEETKSAEQAYLQVLRTKQPQHFVSEYQLGGKDFVFEISAYPSRDGLSVFVKDVTERRRTELELQKVERLESVGTLAGGIAHDFNNILTGILGNISLAQRYVESGGKAAHRLQEAEKASLRARDLTQQLLTFTKGGEPVRRTASIRELVQDSAQFALRGSRVRCEFTLPDDLRAVEIDEGQMNQVISNLVINADEAMPEGGTLNIEARNTVIEEETTLPLPEGKYVEVTVEDHGVGISEEHLGRIFEPYFTTKQKGSGLGLATAYSIIQNHDGHISAESKLGAGTTFHIYLPASERRTPESREAAVQPAPVTRVRILVMDDEEIIRELLHEELTDIGYEVELTEDGADAIERYARARDSGQPFAALIMDLTIPGGMGGQEAIGKLLEIDPEAKVIVSSGYSTDPIMADFKEYGFSAVAAKPYSTEELEETLRGILKGKK